MPPLQPQPPIPRPFRIANWRAQSVAAAMHLQELIVEGFKSYANRTVIAQWDAEFNAITGLNGSGKSNILDAICFVLGMENLKAARAASLQDLVYKRGAAGVNKATVTAVFNNADRSRSPVGYADSSTITVTRQVVVGGRNKFLINGHVALQKNVENLFQSVQLNVHNPHFMILQGQITKVLNMRPPEILAMVEEAAGTRMYEDRQQKATVAIARKEQTVAEIGETLRTVIRPKLDALRRERTHFFAFERAQHEAASVQRAILQQEAATTRKQLQEARKGRENVDTEAMRLRGRRDEINASVDAAQEAISEAAQRRAADDAANAALPPLTQAIAAMQREVTQFEAKVRVCNSVISEATIDAKRAQKSQQTVDAAFAAKTAETVATKEALTAAEQQAAVLRDRVALASQPAQLRAHLQQDVVRLETTHAAAGKRLDELNASLERSVDGSSLQKALKAFEKERAALQKVIDASVPEIAAAVNGDGADDAAVKRRFLRDALRETEDALRSVSQRVTGLQFSYDAAACGVDSNRVFGPLAQLCSADATHETALETCAGSRLFNVVVESDEVATALLERGNLRRRTTFIPLNRITPPFVVSRAKIEAARKKYPGSIDRAIDLVQCDARFRSAAEFAFGSSVVCSRADAAARIAFECGVRTVTLDGDAYDPSGTLTGGTSAASGRSSNGATSPFAAAKLREKQAKLREELAAVEASIARHRTACEEAAKVARDCEIAREQLRFLDAKIADTQRAIDEAAATKQQASAQKEHIKRLDAELEACRSAFASSNSNKNFARDVAQRDADELHALTKTIAALRAKVHAFTVELEELAREKAQTEAAAIRATDALATAQRELTEVSDGLVAKRTLLAQNAALHAAESARITALDAVVERCTAERDALKRELSHVTRSLAAAEREAAQLRASEDDLAAKLRAFPPEVQTAATSDDSKSPSIESLRKRLGELRKQLDELPVDARHRGVLDMIEAVETKERRLVSMLETVQRDKRKIADTIAKLNALKRDALHKTIRDVDGDFGVVLGELLGAQSVCRLVPTNDSSDAEVNGLAINVSLDAGATWKTSLSELSGGQRSLVALSLILALLRHRPAPMYILDEVDAALDLSHTQSIGALLKSGMFRGSQFIVVSLKDGMFSNANVLFRTSFKDGVSTVQRIAASLSDAPASKGRDAASLSKKASLIRTSKRAEIVAAASPSTAN